MTNGRAQSKILQEIEMAISSLPEGSILSTDKAFEVARRTALSSVTEDNPSMVERETNKAVLKILRETDPAVRGLIAKQLVGISFEDVIETVMQARERFHGSRKLSITPKPTLAYSGECEPLDPWNLFCNAIHVQVEANDACVRGALTAEDEQLLNQIKRCVQMLHFICHNEVKLINVTGRPFDGSLTTPEQQYRWA